MNLGIVGSGKIVATFLEALKEESKIKYWAICGREKSTEKLGALKKTYDIEQLYFDFDAFLADDQMDTVYVALPNNMHYAYAKKALEKGKNVICEKPFTVTAKELSHLIQIAEEHNVFLFEAIIPIHLPNYKQLQKDLEGVGDIKVIQLNFSQYSSRYDDFKAGGLPIAFDPAYAGGALMDLNIYNIHFLVGLFGTPVKYTYYPNMDRGIDTSGAAIFEYPDFLCVLTGAKDSASPSSVIIQGTEGALYVNSAASMLKDYSLVDRKTGIRRDINIQEKEKHIMVYEFLAFEELIRKKDYKKTAELLKHSQKVMELCYNLRIAANIKFPADQEEEQI